MRSNNNRGLLEGGTLQEAQNKSVKLCECGIGESYYTSNSAVVLNLIMVVRPRAEDDSKWDMHRIRAEVGGFGADPTWSRLLPW